LDPWFVLVLQFHINPVLFSTLFNGGETGGETCSVERFVVFLEGFKRLRLESLKNLKKGGGHEEAFQSVVFHMRCDRSTVVSAVPAKADVITTNYQTFDLKWSEVGGGTAKATGEITLDVNRLNNPGQTAF